MEPPDDTHSSNLGETENSEPASVEAKTIQNSENENEELESTQKPESQKNDAGSESSSNTTGTGSEKTLELETQDTDLKIPQEHARLDVLLTQIPKKAQHGLLMQCDLILTCIDADENYIALGTNIGLTFLYNRKDQSMQRLKSETSSDVITCVKLHHGVDHQLATGMASGTLSIFLIPGYISLHKKQLQKFEVRSVHRHYIACVEWSTNGMKLFSGDKTGHVVCTEVDFYQGQCKSSELLVEPPTEIVQLHYDHKVLLVSTKARSFVCRLDTTCEVIQVGQKDRKVQGNFGACFIPGLCKTDDAKLYAARPGCRIWLSDIKGTVCNTHIFKDQISSGVREIPLLRPGRNIAPNMELQFGRLHVFREKQLVTFSQSTLFILDPAMNKVVASQSKLGGIVDVAVTGDEIFVLRRHTEDMVVRIAENPETIYHTASTFDLPFPSVASVDPPATLPLANQRLEQEQRSSSPKGFLKKTFFTPFKKLDNFIHEHSRQTRDTDCLPRPAPSARPENENVAARIAGEGRQEDSSPDLPPVVQLESPDLAVHVFKGGQEPTSPKDIASPDSADSALSAFADELTDSRQEDASGTVTIQVTTPDGSEVFPKTEAEHLGPIADRIHLSAKSASGNEDIVFTHHGRKKKAKKKKHRGKSGETEEDNVSESSFGSQASEEIRPDVFDVEQDLQTSASYDKEESDALRRAEEALSIVDEILKKGSPSQVPSPEEILSLAEPKTLQSEETENQTETDQSLAGTPSSCTLTELRDAVSADVSEERDVVPAVSTISDDTSAISHKNKTVMEQISKPVTDSPLEVVNPGEDPLAAAEKTLLSMKRGHSSQVPREDSADDFYNLFSATYSPTDVFESPIFASTASKSKATSESQNPKPAADRQLSTGSAGSDGDPSKPEVAFNSLANVWSEFTTPANIYSLALSQTHIWFTDKSENLYYSALGGVKGILWRKVAEPASQISVSASGDIVWRLYRGKVFAGTKITHRHPQGLKWVEVARDVSYISVDNRCAWYVKTNGEVMMQRDLSKERPCFRSVAVPSDVKVKKVMAQFGVVWAVTESLKLIVRCGITPDVPQGLSWQEIHRHIEPFLFSSCSVDGEGIGWAMDVLGQIWFTDRISPTSPCGSGHWWQVPLSEYYIQDPTLLDMIRSIAKRFDPQKFAQVMSTTRGGLIAAGVQGVWLAMDYQNTLNVCRGSMQGYHWSPAQPSQMAEATTWKQVQASIASLDWGLVWAQQVNGELYAIPSDSSDATLVDSPVFVSVGVNEHSVWGLTSDGEIHVLTGMGQHCPHGVAWAFLDLAQLGDVFLVHLSCNNSFVWAVDSEGQVFNRIGAGAPRPGQLNPVWLPIDTYSEIIFTKVVNGPLDWMVWAVDNRRLTYVRVGITEEMPIGKEWVHVPGIQAMDVTLSSSGVWALNTNGEIFFRYGITQDNVSGNYWKKIPGAFLKISASSNDVLWAVNTSGQLVKCSTRFLFRRQDSCDQLVRRTVSSTGSEEGDWELV